MRVILYVISTLAILFLLALLVLSIKDYKPEKTKVINKAENHNPLSQDTFKLITWNIGYSGLGKEMSFFYDGGNEVRATKERTQENLDKIKYYLKQNQHIDFLLLQEVDKASRRSYYINQLKELRNNLEKHKGYFALNYKVPYVPVPLFKSLGKVAGGLATFTAHNPFKIVRHQFPGQYTWPKNLFMLDRCFLVCRYKLENGNDLLVINTHNSAYDNGTLKEKEMNALKQFITKEYNAGNYVIVGGDWNQFPPEIGKTEKSNQLYNISKAKTIAKDFLAEKWQWAYDPKIPTNRSLDKPLNPWTDMTIIDFFLLSPNIQLIKVKTKDLKFENSDHQPVHLEVVLNDHNK